MKSYRMREQMHDELVPHLLLSRGVPLPQHETFLNPDFERDSHDPFLLPDMEKAVERILFAVESGERVAVWSDYDCDGIPGGVMLSDFLQVMGLQVRHYIPHRHNEGYGLNTGGIDELCAQGVSLIITIDLGTTEHDAIAYAKRKGIDVIVTDHHLVHEEPTTENSPQRSSDLLSEPSARQARPFALSSLPPAFAVINPKRPDSQYPFGGLCGAGVAWKLVQALLTKKRPNGFVEGQEKWYLDLVGLATLSDMVPLVEENRMLARFGLMVMRKNRRPGLAQLLALLRIKPGSLSEDDVGFMLGPRINAASRMDSPHIAARLLATRDLGEALELARTLNGINDERKGLVAVTVKEVNKRMRNNEFDATSPLIVMGNPKWRPGILGLVANSLMQAHGKAVFLWGREGLPAGGVGGELLRGSCRSDGSLNIVELMDAAQRAASQASSLGALSGGLFDHFGGHAASGGFSLAPERAHELRPRLLEAFEKNKSTLKSEQEVLLDRQLDLAEVPYAHKALAALSPFGIENHKPLFLFPNVSIASVRTFGKAKDHLELSLEREGAAVAGVSFFSTPDSYQKPAAAGQRADIVGHVETDWRGGPRLRIVDVI